MSKKPFILLSFLISFSAVADVIMTVKLQNEVYDKNVKVSGEVRSGVMFEGHGTSKVTLPPQFLYLNIGKNGFKTICGKLISVNGQYEATFSTTGLSHSNGIVQLKLDSKFDKLINEYPHTDLSVLTYEGFKSCKKVGRIIPASWSNDTAQELIVYLNSGQFNTNLLIYSKTRKKPAVIPCRKIDGDGKIAYDTACTIKLENNLDLSKTKIKRSNGDNYAKLIKLPIHLVSKIK